MELGSYAGFVGAASVCDLVSEQAARAAEARGYATVSEIGFPKDCFLGSFEMPHEGGWGKAKEMAQAKAKELKYELQYESMYFDDDDPASEE